jgi:hypothetical protein
MMLRILAFTAIAFSVLSPLIVGAVYLSFWRAEGAISTANLALFAGLVALCALSGSLSWNAIQLGKRASN